MEPKPAFPAHAGKALAVMFAAPPGANAISLDAAEITAILFAVIIIVFTAAGLFGASTALGMRLARIMQLKVADSQNPAVQYNDAKPYHSTAGGGKATAKSVSTARRTDSRLVTFGKYKGLTFENAYASTSNSYHRWIKTTVSSTESSPGLRELAEYIAQREVEDTDEVGTPSAGPERH